MSDCLTDSDSDDSDSDGTISQHSVCHRSVRHGGQWPGRNDVRVDPSWKPRISENEAIVNC